jgi:hypothetical protein
MPAGDGTGPMGMGPMTGRASGYCAGYGAPGAWNPAGGRGMGYGRGFGMGRGRAWRRGFGGAGFVPPAEAAWAAPDREQELRMLRSQSDQLSRTLEEVRNRIEALEAKDV